MESEKKAAKNPNDEQILKKGRHRKKQLYNSILQQMEFYFSDSNLTKDRFLSQLLQQDRYVDLNVFLKFNKIRKLTSSVEDVKKAIKKSTIIEFSEDKCSVCRKEPIKEKTNVDECTIYVERLQSDATHEWLSSVFSEFGNVVYVSIPKYKHNNVIKGFAFIEFDKEDEAQKALNYFESVGCKMPSLTEPAQLCSIATFEGPNEQNIEVKVSTNVKKIKEGNERSTNGDGKKTKTEDEVSNAEEKTASAEKMSKRKLEDMEERSENEGSSKKLKAEGEEVSESDDTESKRKKKLKKEHKKKNYIKDLGLQVLSKKEWKRMRNRYLELQKKKMQELKKHLYHAKYSQANYENKLKKSKNNTDTNNSDAKTELNENKSGPESTQSYEFKEGLIMKIKLMDPITDSKKLKNDIRSLSSDIMYVDVPNVGSEDIYVRFNNNQSAKEFCNQEFYGKKEILVGEEEKAYWEKMQQDREHKLQKSSKKQRGRDKLLKKAKRIKFDE